MKYYLFVEGIEINAKDDNDAYLKCQQLQKMFTLLGSEDPIAYWMDEKEYAKYCSRDC